MKLKTALALLVLFGSLPFAAAGTDIRQEDGDISGRAMLFDLTRFDPDLAAVAGMAHAKVSWFNGAITFDKGDDGWVYATAAGAGDPTQERLIPTGTWYNFTDDNGHTWVVREWYTLQVREVEYRLGEETAVERTGHKAYVWTVKTSGSPLKDTGLGLTYNFVVVVDTARLGLIPVDEDGNDAGAPFSPDGGPTGDIDLYFSKTKPESRCPTC